MTKTNEDGDMSQSKSQPGSPGYPDIPEDETAVTDESRANEAEMPTENGEKQRRRSQEHAKPGNEPDGGEAILSGRPRETGGERP